MLALSATAAAQDTPVGAGAAGQGAASQVPAGSGPTVRVFIDCQNTSCDHDFFRTEIIFIDHVQRRQDADVHVQITSQQTGAEGRELTFSFFGQGRFDGRNQTLKHVVLVASSDDDVRRAMARMISIGLVPYALDSPAMRDLVVSIQRQGTPAAVLKANDPWDRWTFQGRLNGNANGEASTTSLSLSGAFSANRVTDNTKFNASVHGSYDENNYVLPDGENFLASNRNYGANSLFVKSLGPKWSTGVRGSLSQNTFQNQDANLLIAPAVEYDIFPYSESTRRLLTIQYAAGLRAFNYHAETVYNKMEEAMGVQSLSSTLSLRQRWGTVSSGFEAQSYIPKVDQNHVTWYGDLNLNIYQGLGLNLSFELSSIRDQVYLPLEEATEEEVLVRQRQLPTTYRYYYYFGVSYTFGSIYSPVVNPRMGN
jgi:hypothetical protein